MFSGVYICKFFVPVVMIFFDVFHDLSAMPFSANIKTGRRLLLTSRFLFGDVYFTCLMSFASSDLPPAPMYTSTAMTAI